MNELESIFARADGFERTSNHALKPNSQVNIRLALIQMGVSLSHNVFSDRLLITFTGGPVTLLDDAAVERLWLDIDLRYHFRPSKDFFHTVLRDLARRNPFHPVRDYFDGLSWDGQCRIDNWLVKYGGAQDDAFVRAVGALVLIAAVRRVRVPGTKFDEMLVLEGPQGLGEKSSAIAALCPDLAWFSDDLPLSADAREVIERTSGRFLIEAAELSGMGKRDVEHLKAFLSRQTDIARLSYDRMVTERPRHFIVIGTTNSDAYLRDATGNRRFWPVAVTGFDVSGLKADRDQLWAEAAAREKEGCSIRLDRALWGAAAVQQEDRRMADPWEDQLTDLFGEKQGKVLVSDVFSLLGVENVRRTQEMQQRVGTIMRKLGFARTRLRHNGLLRQHYVRGPKEEWGNCLKPSM